MLQNQKQSTTKQWIDLPSESQSEDEDNHTTNQQPQKKNNRQPTKQLTLEQHTSKQLANLKKAFDQVWLIITSSDDFSLKRKMEQIRKLKQSNPQILLVFQNKQNKSVWDVKVTLKIAEQWIKNGLDKQRTIKITLSPRSIKRQPRNDGQGNQRGERRQRGDRNGQYRQRGRRHQGDDRGEGRERRGRGGRGGGRGRRDDRNRGDRQQGKKVTYVNKQTGEKAKNKQLMETRLIEQKSRQYSKKQAERRGLQLGNFRNKPKIQHHESEQPQSQEQSHHSSQKRQEKGEHHYVNPKKQHKVKVDVNNINELKSQLKEEIVDNDNTKKLKPLWAFKQIDSTSQKVQQKNQPIQDKKEQKEIPKVQKQNNWNRKDNKQKQYVNKNTNQQAQNQRKYPKQQRPYKKDYQNKEWKADQNQNNKFYQKGSSNYNGTKPYRQKRQYNDKQEQNSKKVYQSKDNENGNKFNAKPTQGKKKYTSKNDTQKDSKNSKPEEINQKSSNIKKSSTFQMIEVDSD